MSEALYAQTARFDYGLAELASSGARGYADVPNVTDIRVYITSDGTVEVPALHDRSSEFAMLVVSKDGTLRADRLALIPRFQAIVGWLPVPPDSALWTAVLEHVRPDAAPAVTAWTAELAARLAENLRGLCYDVPDQPPQALGETVIGDTKLDCTYTVHACNNDDAINGKRYADMLKVTLTYWRGDAFGESSSKLVECSHYVVRELKPIEFVTNPTEWPLANA